jgi:hypothetical protein
MYTALYDSVPYSIYFNEGKYVLQFGVRIFFPETLFEILHVSFAFMFTTVDVSHIESRNLFYNR